MEVKKVLVSAFLLTTCLMSGQAQRHIHTLACKPARTPTCQPSCLPADRSACVPACRHTDKRAGRLFAND